MHTDYNTNYVVFLKYNGSQMCVGEAGWERGQGGRQEEEREAGGLK